MALCWVHLAAGAARPCRLVQPRSAGFCPHHREDKSLGAPRTCTQPLIAPLPVPAGPVQGPGLPDPTGSRASPLCPRTRVSDPGTVDGLSALWAHKAGAAGAGCVLGLPSARSSAWGAQTQAQERRPLQSLSWWHRHQCPQALLVVRVVVGGLAFLCAGPAARSPSPQGRRPAMLTGPVEHLGEAVTPPPRKMLPGQA